MPSQRLVGSVGGIEERHRFRLWCSNERKVRAEAHGLGMGMGMDPWKACLVYLVRWSLLWNLGWGVTLESDIQALTLLKNAVQPSSVGPTTCLGTWDFTVDPCDFRSTTQFVCGIRCDAKTNGVSRVTSVALDGAGYKGYLHPAVGNLSELVELDISRNSFRGPIPQSIARLSKLVRLDFSENLLSGHLPPSLGRLASLQVLSLSKNLLYGSLPASLNDLRNLVRLDLSYNRFSGTLPSLHGFAHLYTLDVSFNCLTGSLPPQFPLPLSQITLKGNFLSGALPAVLSSLQGLGVLDVSSNRLSGTIDGRLFANPSLQQVNLSNNSFTGLAVPNVSTQGSQIVAVDIGHNRIRGLLPANFASLNSLAALSLRYNFFHGSIPPEYGAKAKSTAHGVTPLARLFLDGNFLSGDIPADFLSISPDKITGSFADNCLKSCPPSIILCQGAQKPDFLCRRTRGSRNIHPAP